MNHDNTQICFEKVKKIQFLVFIKTFKKLKTYLNKMTYF